MVDATEELLAARGKTHGDWGKNAETTQGVMRLLEKTDRWPTISDVHREGVHFIIHKIVRSLNGDPMEPDHYDDVAGYARLVAQWIRRQLVDIPGVDEEHEGMDRRVAAQTQGVSTLTEG